MLTTTNGWCSWAQVRTVRGLCLGCISSNNKPVLRLADALQQLQRVAALHCGPQCLQLKRVIPLWWSGGALRCCMVIGWCSLAQVCAVLACMRLKLVRQQTSATSCRRTAADLKHGVSLITVSSRHQGGGWCHHCVPHSHTWLSCF
jgi:hypothetical protein